jgi:hypothetical protein
MFGCRGSDRSGESAEPSQQVAPELKDGFYQIVREGTPNEELIVTDRERLMVFRPKGSNVPVDIPPRFVVVPNEPAIRLTLSAPPGIVPSQRGVSDIRVELVEGEAAKVLAFSEANRGRRIAVIVDGEVVSTPEVSRPFSSNALLIQCPSEEMCNSTLEYLEKAR